jgi:hypothetical protein
MRSFFRASVIAFALGMSGAGLANAASLTMISGYYPFKTGSTYSVTWTGGPPGGFVNMTVDRRVGTGAWMQPYRWLRLGTGGLLEPTAGQNQSIGNTGFLTGVIPANQPPFECGLGLQYRVVVFRSSWGYGYGQPYHVPC